MKKAVSLLLTAVVGLSLISCGSNMGNINSGAVIISMCDCCASKLKERTNIEFQEKHEFKKRIFAPAFKTVEFSGKKIKGTYSETLYTSNYNGVYDVYNGTDENGNEFSFYVNKKTGELKRYSLYLSEENRESLADMEKEKMGEREYAEEFLESGYTLADEESRTNGIAYNYRKTVNGDYITDIVSITVDKSGELTEIDFNETFKDGKIPEIDEKKQAKIIDEKLKEILKEGVTSEIVEKRVRRFENGSYGVQYEIELVNSVNEIEGKSTLYLLVYI